MASKRRPLHSPSSKLNFRPNSETPGWETKGKKPLPEPATVKQVLLMMIVHVCRRTLFVDTSIKVAIYGATLFLVSILADVLPFPKTYFSRSDNVLNQYFVKLGWGWTLFVTSPFLFMTSFTYCCGKRDRILQHFARLGIATFAWYFWTTLFWYIETVYGRCNASPEKFQTKETCLAGGYFWHGFDISGHVFILIYSSLVLIEEARAINGWEGIRDLIRNEEHARNVGDVSVTSNPLRGLSFEEFSNLKESYDKFTVYIRLFFIAMTFLSVLWDVMLVSTILYYHKVIEKFVSGAIAILTWFFTYRYWYTLPRALPNLPGEGLFKYKDVRQPKEPAKRRSITTAPQSNAKHQLPTFMGMPLYGLRNQENREQKDEDTDIETDTQLNSSNKS
ncbi:FIT family protein CG10671 [Zootermopsis nevadensis]|uniref:FIT family protein n=1 Tax=Zootermopsis nevadensis TaxID=136037 RepID=A0A067QY51_ZOONE|nr:FIT family protein CG10671 [Zootermopsis nevadensis]KDR11133.1 FIT family protein [Zootermopsis nevadensis]